MVKSKRIDSCFKKTCDEYEKNASTSSKIKKLYENPKIEENEKQLFKVPKVLVSTATTERSFSTMKITKNRLKNKMETDFLASTILKGILQPASILKISSHSKNVEEHSH